MQHDRAEACTAAMLTVAHLSVLSCCSGGVKLPQDDKSERIFDVPSLDANTSANDIDCTRFRDESTRADFERLVLPVCAGRLMSFACERLQVCYSNPAQLNTPALQARRAEPETVALESLRKLRFRSDGLQEGARKDLVPAMTEVLRALTMDNTKVHLLEICGIPADATLSQTATDISRCEQTLL
jgi:hypothetical protein